MFVQAPIPDLLDGDDVVLTKQAVSVVDSPNGVNALPAIFNVEPYCHSLIGKIIDYFMGLIGLLYRSAFGSKGWFFKVE